MLDKSNLHPKYDGITHINIYTKGNTELGRKLSNLATCNLVLKDGSTFKTVEGFWYSERIKMILSKLKIHSNSKLLFLKELDTKLSKLEGHAAKSYGKMIIDKLLKKYNLPLTILDLDDIFKRNIISVILLKITSDPDLKKLVLENTLPYAHYYYYGDSEKDVKIIHDKNEWQIKGIEKIAEAIKKDNDEKHK